MNALKFVPAPLAALTNTVPTVDEVYRDHGRLILRWAARLGGSRVDPLDVAQEVYLTLHRTLPSFRGEAQLTTFLFRVTNNAVRHHRRQARFRSWLKGDAKEVAGNLPSEVPSAQTSIEQREAQRQLQTIFDQMSEKYRTVLVLFELEDMSGQQIAELMGARVETVWVWLHRARAQFSELHSKASSQ